jgi:hypothetical protein
MAYPAALDNLSTTHTAGQVFTATDFNAVAAGVDTLEAKLGIVASTPVAGSVLASTATGSSAWVTKHPIHATVTSAYTVVAADADGIIPANAVAASFAITLPSAASVPAGTQFTVRHLNPSATTNVVNVTPAGTDTIDLVAGPYPLSSKGGITVLSNGVNGWIAK